MRPVRRRGPLRCARCRPFEAEHLGVIAKGVRARILEICAEAARTLGFEPEVRFRGAIDHRAGETVADELCSTLREALANVARHASAEHVEVEVTDAPRLIVRSEGEGADFPQDERHLATIQLVHA